MHQRSDFTLSQVMLITAILVLNFSNKSFAAVDAICQSDCTGKGYSYNYCQQACSYNGSTSGSGPMDAFYGVQKKHLENELLKQEIERRKAELNSSNSTSCSDTATESSLKKTIEEYKKLITEYRDRETNLSNELDTLKRSCSQSTK